jgi:uncharacterized membrane protein HdeD (DUF308 family)
MILSILAIVAGIRGPEGSRWLLLAEGVLGVLAGLVAFFWVLMFVISAWAIVTGLLKLVMVIRLRREIRDEWAMIVGGALSVLFGVILAVGGPEIGLYSLNSLLGIYAVALGSLLLITAFRVRKQSGVETAG